MRDPDGNLPLADALEQRQVRRSRRAAAVHHGDSGTVLTALARGLPMVVIPVSADQPDNALRCERLGVAKVVSPQDRTPEAIRESVRAVLRNPEYRHNAERLREEMRALPGPGQEVGKLERLAAKQQPLAAAP